MAAGVRVETADQRPSPANNGKTAAAEPQGSLMTPARRAALDALEREFSDLLKAR